MKRTEEWESLNRIWKALTVEQRAELYNDFELSDCYDSDYKELGISRTDLTAECLASVEQIKEVHMNFIDANGDECDFGWNEADEDFKIKLLEVSFSDLDNLEKYTVNPEVLDKFNEGVN